MTDPHMQIIAMVAEALAIERKRHQIEHDALVKALALQEKAEETHANCEECGGEDIPETCPACFPLYDDARIARRSILALVSRSGNRNG